MTTSLPYFKRKASLGSSIGTHQSEISHFDGKSPAVRFAPLGILNTDEESFIFVTKSCFFFYTYSDGDRHKVPYSQGLPINLVNLLNVLATGKPDSLDLVSRLLSVYQATVILFRDSSHIEDLISRHKIDSVYVDDNRYIDSEQLFKLFCERDRKRESVSYNLILTEQDYVEV